MFRQQWKRIIFLILHECYFSMPELFRMFGLRFFFFSNEHLPIHIHVKNADVTAKFELDPVKLIENKGIKNKDIHLAESIIEENNDLIKERWIEYFGD